MGKLIDLSGQRFGFWIIRKRVDNSNSGQVQWLCICECGKEKTITTNSLRTGNSTSCGCNHVPDLTGETFGQLKVIKLDTLKNIKNKRSWLCKCNCGNTITVNTYQLREKIISSCGHNKKYKKKEDAIECFVKILIPFSKFSELVKKADVSCDSDDLSKAKLLIDINYGEKILSFNHLKF